MSDAPQSHGEYRYIKDKEDREEFRRFCMHHLQHFARPPVAELWHYTTAEGLIGILKSGQLWATQVTCLNDALEQRYFASLVHAELKAQAAQNTDPNLAVMFRVADEGLSNADFATAGNFVVCFSEVEDDLGQWRGYGGGECGYAIVFSLEGILGALKARRPSASFAPMHYGDQGPALLVRDVVRMAQQYFLQGITARGVSDVELWAREFLSVYADELDIFACLIKHPKFDREQERRITTRLQPGEHMQLEFRQKRTLLARHLPVSLTVGTDNPRLPITQVYVGPGPAQRISQVSVGDALKKFYYDGVPVKLSSVPYRVP
jgi:Protein of unknown function (DUF2971)